MINLLSRLFRPDPLDARRRAMRAAPKDDLAQRRTRLMHAQIDKVLELRNDPMCVLNKDCLRFSGQNSEYPQGG